MSGATKPAEPTPRRRLLWVAASCALVLVGLADLRRYQDLRIARQREAQLEERIREAGERVELLRSRIQRLNEDPAAVERLAREQLRMVRPDEVVIVLPPGDKPEPPESGGDS